MACYPSVENLFSGTLEASKSKLMTSANPCRQYLRVINGSNKTISILIGDVQDPDEASGVALNVASNFMSFSVGAGVEKQVDFYGNVSAFTDIGVAVPADATNLTNILVWGR